MKNISFSRLAVAVLISLSSSFSVAGPILTSQVVVLDPSEGADFPLPANRLDAIYGGPFFRLEAPTPESLVASTINKHPKVAFVDERIYFSTGVGPECANGCGVTFDLGLLNPDYIGMAFRIEQTGFYNTVVAQTQSQYGAANFGIDDVTRLLIIPFGADDTLIRLLNYQPDFFSRGGLADPFGIIAINDPGPVTGNPVSVPGTLVLFGIGGAAFGMPLVVFVSAAGAIAFKLVEGQSPKVLRAKSVETKKPVRFPRRLLPIPVNGK